MSEGAEDVTKSPLISYDKVFLTYLSCAGNVERTAVLTRVEPADIEEIVQREGWAAKLAAIETMKDAGDNGKVAIELSRTVSFVQASRIRDLADRALTYFSGLEISEITLQVNPKTGGVVASGKAILELAKAIQIAQECCARALGDTVAEAKLKDSGGAGGAGAARALDVYRTLSLLQQNVKGEGVPDLTPGLEAVSAEAEP